VSLKHLYLISAAAIISACGGSDEPPKSEGVSETTAASAKSDDRPVNLACNEPDYRRGQPDTHIGLHSPLYPSVQAAGERLKQKLIDIEPTVTDEDVYDLEAHEKVKRDMIALSQFTFIMGIDLQPKTQMPLCNFELYETDKCQLMARMMGDGFRVENVLLEGGALSFTVVQVAENIQTNIQLGNTDLDDVKMNVVTGGRRTMRGDWTRDTDGTEYLVASGDGDIYRYTERPDCSGTASWHRGGKNGRPGTSSFTWASARKADFDMSYRLCTENDLGEEQCNSGGL